MPKLLIVDDETDVCDFAKHFFAKRNIEVSVASGGREALNIIGTKKPDLILLDIRMEEMTGMDVLRQLRSQNNNVKVIMVTGVEDEVTLKEAQSLGVQGYIHKPLVLEELENIVTMELLG